MNYIKDKPRVPFATASRLTDQFQSLGLLDETTGGRRFRRFRYTPYRALFDTLRPAAVTADAIARTDSAAGPP